MDNQNSNRIVWVDLLRLVAMLMGIMAIDKHGRDVFLADTSYALALAQENFKDIRFYFTSEF